MIEPSKCASTYLRSVLIGILLSLCSFAVVADADLQVALVMTPDPVANGATLTQRITVTNLGPDAAINANMIVELPGVANPESGIVLFVAGTTTFLPSPPPGWTCNVLAPPPIFPNPPAAYSCSTPSLGVGSVTFTIAGKVRADVAGPIGSSASVSSTDDPVVSNNNTGRIEVAIGNPPALLIPSSGIVATAMLLMLMLGAGSILLRRSQPG